MWDKFLDKRNTLVFQLGLVSEELNERFVTDSNDRFVTDSNKLNKNPGSKVLYI